MTYKTNDTTATLEHGKDLLILRMNAAQISGNLQKITSLDAKPKNGAIVFIKLKEGEDSSKIMQNAQSFLENGASAIIIEETPQTRAQWENIAARPISFTTIGGADKKANPTSLIIVSKDAAENSRRLPTERRLK